MQQQTPHQQPQPQKQKELSDMNTSSSSSSSSGEDRSSQSEEEGNQLRRYSWKVRLPERYRVYALMSSISNVIEPISFDEANEHDEW